MKHYSTYQSQFIEMFKDSPKSAISDFCKVEKGTTITRNEVIEGNIPVVAGGQEPSCYHNVANRKAGVITISASGAYSGFVNYWTTQIFASDCNTIIPIDEKYTNVHFLYHGLKAIQKEIYSLQKGGAQPHVYGKDIEKFLFPYPTKEEQDKFADIAQQADKSKFSNLKSQFIEMFGNVGETRSLCEICRPKQWPTIPTKDFTEDGYFVYGANGVIGHYSEYNHEHPTILMACRGASCGAINISQPKSYITGNAMCMDEVIPDISFEYLAYYLSNYDYKTIITGGAQPQITYTNLKKVMVPIPSYNDQQSFALIYKQADKSKLTQNNTLLNNKLKFCYCYTPRHISS